MKLANKILLSIFFVSIIAVTTIISMYYIIVKEHLLESYVERYDSLGRSISNSFVEMGTLFWLSQPVGLRNSAALRDR